MHRRGLQNFLGAGFAASCGVVRQLAVGDAENVEERDRKNKALPGDRARYWDDNTKRNYWYQASTDEASWENGDFNAPYSEDRWDDDWDFRKSSPNKHKAVHQIILVRHGQYDTRSKRDELRVLTPLGRDQAEAVGRHLRMLLDNQLIYPIDTIYFSTKARASETYSLLYPYLPEMPLHRRMPCSMLREGCVFRAVPEPNWGSHGLPRAEQYLRDGSRVEAAFKNYIQRAPVDCEKSYSSLLVCHGNVIRYFVCRALQLPPTAWARFKLPHTGIVILNVHHNGKVICNRILCNYLNPLL